MALGAIGRRREARGAFEHVRQRELVAQPDEELCRRQPHGLALVVHVLHGRAREGARVDDRARALEHLRKAKRMATIRAAALERRGKRVRVPICTERLRVAANCRGLHGGNLAAMLLVKASVRDHLHGGRRFANSVARQLLCRPCVSPPATCSLHVSPLTPSEEGLAVPALVLFGSAGPALLLDVAIELGT